ncbi:MAG: GDSL-type esterase/lipase family protein [Opitutales bacterium]|jgi:lysophospholipase L1-like esterase|nr:GDSL-type esterase/lipase family protein [Opitutales bacterium]MDP4658204.1 GDSL-type esterase/lipase family protein [Opitutales bacterium]MDP4775568.1 GDSL-type esterase/lipase family protein [Opitutales bacterium]MDP4786926.1 GDSL-type esterase/lipase family protein [Opitutales bacterium]MDP4860369.1 GDSL-type esterase/lipase family protein [Opitutales bacterium]
MRLFFSALALCAAVLGQAADKDFPLAEAREVTPRGGLPNFFRKAQTTGAEIKVGYLGGSITAQKGWRVQTLAHFQQAYPQASFTEINAAIGGTGSDLGVFRVQQDVLSKGPDLLFVEFAVNDGGADPQRIIRAMEGIVRQTWKADPKTDICFVYTLTESLSPPMLEGKLQRSASAMEKVADFYGIPSIVLGMEVAKLAKAGQLVWRAKLPKTEAERAALAGKFVFAADGTHPHDSTGQVLYTQAIIRSLPALAIANATPTPHVTGPALDPANWERATLVPITAAKLSAGLTPVDMKADAFAKNWANRLPAMVRLTQAGQSIEFKFQGTHCAVYDVVGPAGGMVAVTLDGQPQKPAQRIDAYCTYARLANFIVGTDLPEGVHTVRLELLADPIDKAAVLAKNQNKIDKPERFAPLEFTPGGLLILGELVP